MSSSSSSRSATPGYYDDDRRDIAKRAVKEAAELLKDDAAEKAEVDARKAAERAARKRRSQDAEEDSDCARKRRRREKKKAKEEEDRKRLDSLTKITRDLYAKVDEFTKGSVNVNPKVEEQLKTWSTANQFRNVGLKKQYMLNAEVLRDLSQVKTPDPHLDSAIKALQGRNRVLELADKNPGVFQVIDAEEATKGLDEVSSGLSKPVREYLTSDSATRRRRFQAAGSNNARLGSGSTQGLFSYYPESRRQPPSLLSIPTSNPSIKCYGCGSYGHVKRDCTKKFQGRRYPY